LRTDYQQQIDTLKIEIAHDEHILSALEVEVRSLQGELTLFKATYDSAVAAIMERIKMVKEAIQDLQSAQNAQIYEHMGEDYVSVTEQYRRAWEAPKDEPSKPISTEIPAITPSSDIKKLYYELARRYHPDTATTEADIAYCTRLMAQINAAYAAGDSDTLKTLLHQDGKVNPDEPLALLQIRDLQQTLQKLRENIFNLKQQQHALMNCDLMQLKVEESLARAKGRNLFKEMAERFEGEYRNLLRKLYDLRQQAN
jgi:hypothetical protein